MNKQRTSVDLRLNKEETRKFNTMLKFNATEITSIVLTIAVIICQIIAFINTTDLTHLAFIIFALLYLTDFIKLTKRNRFANFILEILLGRMERGEVDCDNIEITPNEEE